MYLYGLVTATVILSGILVVLLRIDLKNAKLCRLRRKKHGTRATMIGSSLFVYAVLLVMAFLKYNVGLVLSVLGLAFTVLAVIFQESIRTAYSPKT